MPLTKVRIDREILNRNGSRKRVAGPVQKLPLKKGQKAYDAMLDAIGKRAASLVGKQRVARSAVVDAETNEVLQVYGGLLF